MDSDTKPLFDKPGTIIVLGIVLSFGLGIVFFLTVARGRSGDPIPPDATPNYFIEDAGPAGDKAH